MLNVLVAVALCSAPTVVSAPSVTPAEAPRWELFTALSGGMLLDSGAGAASSRIGVSRQVTAVFVPELQLLLSVAPGVETLATGIRLGARFELPREGMRPYAYLAFAHQHEANFEHVAQEPLPIIFGLSENGVGHRTGADIGGGLVYDFPKVREQTLAGRAGVRLSTVALLGAGAPLSVELLGTFGVLF